jgi:hypothetical protein
MKSPEMFFSHSLVANVYRLLETYRFSLAARRFVYGLIDGSAHTPGYWQSMYGDDHLPLPCDLPRLTRLLLSPPSLQSPVPRRKRCGNASASGWPVDATAGRPTPTPRRRRSPRHVRAKTPLNNCAYFHHNYRRGVVARPPSS